MENFKPPVSWLPAYLVVRFPSPAITYPKVISLQPCVNVQNVQPWETNALVDCHELCRSGYWYRIVQHTLWMGE